METNIGLEKTDIERSVGYLEIFLASENILNLKIRNFHWNVKSLHFFELHKFFEELYSESSENIDEIAERIRFLGSHTKASFSDFLVKSFIVDEEREDILEKEMIKIILIDKQKIIIELRKAIKSIGKGDDMGTEDFLTGLMQKNEKNAWMLRSMLS